MNYTNAATIINEDFKDTEDLDGVFSGLMEYKGGVAEWPFNGFTNQYDGASWQYAAPVGTRAAARRPPVRRSAVELKTGTEPQRLSRRWSAVRPLVSRSKPPVLKDETLQNPRCVFQIVKRHFARYTPEMVEKTTGCPKETFLKVAETILANSGADRTTSFAYAVAWTQHTYGVQIIGACALLQLLLGNIGRPGAGVMALRGHASIQGSTDIPTLYHSIQGYMSAPDGAQEARHAAGLPRGRDDADGLLGEHAEVRGVLSEVHVRRGRDQGEPVRLRLASEDSRRPLAHGDVRRDERRQGQGHVLHRAESRPRRSTPSWSARR